MAGEIREIPRHGRIRTPEYFRTIDESYVVELGAPYPFRLHDPEQARFMQITLCLRWQTPQFFRECRTFAKSRKQRFGATSHGRKGLVLRIRPQGLACARLSTNTRHLGSLTISPVALPWDSTDRKNEGSPRFVRRIETSLTGRHDLAIVYRLINQLRRGRRSPSIENNGETD
jgi:hypothetical protein